MKNKILATLVAFGLVGSASAIEINDNLSINGFIDGSISKTDVGSGTATGDLGHWGADEIEVDFLFNVGSVSGEVHLDSVDADGNDNFDIEQAHFTYSLENGIALTFGKYGSALGLEREDPAGLYTYSRAYQDSGFNLGNVDANAREGLTISYSAEAWTLGVSVENESGELRVNNAKDDLDFTVALSYTGIENVSFNAGYRKDNQTFAINEVDVFNVNATYQVGKALIGAEYSKTNESSRTLGTADATSTSTAGDRDAMLILVDYDVSDKLGIAVRYSSEETTVLGQEIDTITIAPNYAITESLGAILEYSDISRDVANTDSDLIALELTYTF
jgi:hypothetical protein